MHKPLVTLHDIVNFFGFLAFFILIVLNYFAAAKFTSSVSSSASFSTNTPSSSKSMAWRCSGRSNSQLVTNLRKGALINSDAVEAAMRAVDRGNYVPSSVADSAYDDSPQPIGYQATISAPHMHAMCLEILLPNLKNGARVLDVGSGSGYLTAAMAHLVKPDGHVYGVEHVPELVKFARNNVQKDDAKLGAYVTFLTGDGRVGYPDKAPFDAIHVGAAAPQIPKDLINQLKVGGRMIIPVGERFGGQQLILVKKTSETDYESEVITHVMYVPLTDLNKQVRS